MDFWPSRVHSAKHLSAVQDNRLSINDTEGDDDVRAWFPCPFCYVEVEIPVLCSHLQEEHCFGLENAVCPICAANLGKDAIGHFSVQHAHSIKRRKSQKLGFNSSPVLVKDVQELNTFLGSNWDTGRVDAHETTLDPLLSPFFCNITLSDPKSNLEDELSSNVASTTPDVKSSGSYMLDEAQEQDYQERMQKAGFVEQLILSTIF